MHAHAQLHTLLPQAVNQTFRDIQDLKAVFYSPASGRRQRKILT